MNRSTPRSVRPDSDLESRIGFELATTRLSFNALTNVALREYLEARSSEREGTFAQHLANVFSDAPSDEPRLVVKFSYAESNPGELHLDCTVVGGKESEDLANYATLEVRPEPQPLGRSRTSVFLRAHNADPDFSGVSLYVASVAAGVAATLEVQLVDLDPALRASATS